MEMKQLKQVQMPKELPDEGERAKTGQGGGGGEGPGRRP